MGGRDCSGAGCALSDSTSQSDVIKDGGKDLMTMDGDEGMVRRIEKIILDFSSYFVIIVATTTLVAIVVVCCHVVAHMTPKTSYVSYNEVMQGVSEINDSGNATAGRVGPSAESGVVLDEDWIPEIPPEIRNNISERNANVIRKWLAKLDTVEQRKEFLGNLSDVVQTALKRRQDVTLVIEAYRLKKMEKLREFDASRENRKNVISQDFMIAGALVVALLLCAMIIALFAIERNTRSLN